MDGGQGNMEGEQWTHNGITDNTEYGDLERRRRNMGECAICPVMASVGNP